MSAFDATSVQATGNETSAVATTYDDIGPTVDCISLVCHKNQVQPQVWDLIKCGLTPAKAV